MRAKHLDWCVRRGLRPNTIAAKKGALERFARSVGPTLAEDATAEQVKCWFLTVGGMAQHQHCELSHIRQFFGFLQREGYRADDPTVRLMAPKIRRRLPRPISDADLRKALQHAAEPVKTFLLFGALAGLRSCEIAPLRREDLLLDREVPMLYVADGKGGRDRTVPLHPRLAALAFPYAGYLFPAGGSHIPAKRVVATINAYFRSIGVHATGHQTRHFFACRFYETSNFDLRSTQEVMGHMSPTATANYTRWSMERSGVAVAAIDI